MTQPAAVGWRNYEFTTDLVCPNGHPPGFHPLYVGMSSRPGLRYEQHEAAPWRRYASGFVVHPQVYGSEQDALVAEEWRIRSRLPLANVAHNEGNPCRLDFGSASGRSVVRRPRRTVQPCLRSVRRRWPRPVRRLAWRAGLWLALVVAIFAAEPGTVPFGAAAELSVVGATLLMALPLRRRRRGRSRRW